MKKNDDEWKKMKKREKNEALGWKLKKGSLEQKKKFLKHYRGCQKLKCSIQSILEAFENLQTLLKLGQIFEDTLVRKNENPRAKICS